ncbi:hypothetical protein BKA61DRAFT_570333 [Leptodontidium sp. MPI-SDFR-AT-0119]|nr:hypothetical protein BKA61DRAFT_570333 [Leptodontidium sp. MPI-SDFR-AT-0119]
MQSFNFVTVLLVALSAFTIAHNGEEYALPTAIGVSVLSNSFSATGTVMIWQGVNSTISSTLQPNPTGSVLSSAVSFTDSILTDSLANPTPATSSMAVSIATPTTPLTSTVILASPTSVSSSTATLVSPTNVSSTVSLTPSSSSATTVSTTTAAGAAPAMGVGLGGLLGVAAYVLAAL